MKPNNRSRKKDEHEVHGHAVPGFRSREYKSWVNLIARCTNENHNSYSNYGGRGIRVCDRWMNSFLAFIEDMGPCPSSSHSIDRRDVNGHYTPSNCHWATPKEQARNRRNNVLLTTLGRTQNISAWAEELGVSANSLEQRRKDGWTDEDIIRTPVGWKPPKKYTTKFGAQRARTDRLRAQDLCVNCGKNPAHGKSRCPECASKRRRHPSA
jgi:hypothetical protein